MSGLDDALARLRASIEGARAALLLGSDGMVVAGSADEAGPDRDVLAATYADLVRRAAESNQDAGLEPPAELILTSPASSVLLRRVASEFLLLVVLLPGTILGRARHQVRLAGDGLTPDLLD